MIFKLFLNNFVIKLTIRTSSLEIFIEIESSETFIRFYFYVKQNPKK